MTDVEVRHQVERLCAGWYDDPEGEHQLRYHDGHSWTEHVTHYGPSPCSGCGSRWSS